MTKQLYLGPKPLQAFKGKPPFSQTQQGAGVLLEFFLQVLTGIACVFLPSFQAAMGSCAARPATCRSPTVAVHWPWSNIGRRGRWVSTLHALWSDWPFISINALRFIISSISISVKTGQQLYKLYYIHLLISLDGGYIHQGCWGCGGNVAGTAVSRIRFAVQSQGPGSTHREVTYLSWAAPPYAYACGCVLAYADKHYYSII